MSITPIMLTIPASQQREIHVPWSALLANKAKEFWIKARGRRIRGQGMIGASSETVRAGFGSLVGAHFDEYNLPQAWVDSRMVPRVLDGRVPTEGAVVLDLGCGPASSTRFIAHFARPCWRIVGYDITPHLIEAARGRRLVNRRGEAIAASFVCQDVGAPLRQPVEHAEQCHRAGEGPLTADASVHLAIAAGVVGLYMDAQSVGRLAGELRRVLRPGGYAALDAGPAVPVGVLRELMERAGFAYESTVRSFVWEPRPKLVFRWNSLGHPARNVRGVGGA